MLNKLFLFPLFALAACATGGSRPVPEPIVTTVDVPVPVAAPCVPAALPSEPNYVDSNAALVAAGDAATRYQLLYRGREQRIGRLSQLEPVVAACPREVIR